MSETRVIPVLIAEEIKGSKHFRIFRNIPYIFRNETFEDLSEDENHSEEFEENEEVENGYNAKKIYKIIKRKLREINPFIQNGDTPGLLNNIFHLEELCAMYSKTLTILQARMPRLLIRIYERMEKLDMEAQERLEYYTNVEEMPIIDRLNKMRIVLRETKIKIISFWQGIPEFFIRLPTSITSEYLFPQMFLTEPYLPYITGHPLPEWTDPIVIGVMNEAIRIRETKLQTLFQRKEKMSLLSLIFREHKVPCEILKLIVDYLPVFIVFEFLPCETSCEYLSRTCNTESYIVSKFIS